ncbi:pyridoxamine 5'-phosphate oxidase family protein, partial [Mycobacterium sp. THU-M104]
MAVPTSGTSRADGHSGLVVASEADAPDPDRHAGWNVAVTGMTRRSPTPSRSRLPRPWVNAAATVVSIEP